MSRKLLVALFAFLFAVLSAWADPGGEGGCVNLPGRSGSSPGASSAGFETTVQEWDGVVFVLPPELHDAAVLLRSADLPFALVMRSSDGMLRLSAQTLAALRAAGQSGFTLDFVDALGNRMTVSVAFESGAQLRVRVD